MVEPLASTAHHYNTHCCGDKNLVKMAPSMRGLPELGLLHMLPASFPAFVLRDDFGTSSVVLLVKSKDNTSPSTHVDSCQIDSHVLSKPPLCLSSWLGVLAERGLEDIYFFFAQSWPRLGVLRCIRHRCIGHSHHGSLAHRVRLVSIGVMRHVVVVVMRMLV